jgi:hypothetical protein
VRPGDGERDGERDAALAGAAGPGDADGDMAQAASVLELHAGVERAV